MPLARLNFYLPDSPFVTMFFTRPQPRKVYHNNLLKIMFVDIIIAIFLIIIIYVYDLIIKHITQDHRSYVIIDGIPYDYFETDSDLSDSETDSDDDNFETADSDDN